MTNLIHRDGDARACGATTTVSNQSTVFANGKLIATNGDPNSHGAGGLIAATNKVYVQGIMVVNVGDSAAPDSLCPPLGGAHCGPSATGGDPKIKVGD
jgi:uncharacterized Zn-binding protein involved in type VI secretion